MIRSDLCDYSDAYILVNGTIKITGVGDDANVKIVHHNTQIHNAE